MGSDFLTLEETTAKLGRSKKTVAEYFKKGLLRRIPSGHKVLVPREDVEQLAMDIGANFPPMNRKTFFRLVAQVQRLEMDITVLKRMNGVADAPLRPGREESERLYTMAHRALQDGTWRDEEVGMWVDLFDRMDELFFDVMTHIHPEPWRPFYDLCIAQMHDVANRPQFSTSLHHQHLYRRLNEGLKKIRAVVLVWIETGRSRTADETMRAVEGPARSVAKKLGAKLVSSRE